MLAVAGCATVDPAYDGGSSPKPPPGVGLRAGPEIAAHAPLPAVDLRDLADQPVRLEAAAAGKVALVSFWATWCDACVAELTALNRLDERAKDSGGVVIGVAVGEPRDKVAEFARRHGLAYRQLLDEDLKLADALGQRRLPATIVLDRAGRVVWSGGALDERALAAFRAALGTGG
jgi:peroxiredoxin